MRSIQQLHHHTPFHGIRFYVQSRPGGFEVPIEGTCGFGFSVGLECASKGQGGGGTAQSRSSVSNLKTGKRDGDPSYLVEYLQLWRYQIYLHVNASVANKRGRLAHSRENF